jgi:O-antigen ligase/polysaccharide polymerase Wzy-like membrane protein
VTERLAKIAPICGILVLLPWLVYVAYTRPGYFSSPTYLSGLLMLEFLLAAIWMYRRFFFVLVVLAFLFAGVDLPLGGMWTMGRWLFLVAGAAVGCFIMLKQRQARFSLFHVLVFFSILAALVSAAVSRYPSFALMKALSLMLLFLYAGTGARIAVAGRETRFFAGLLLGSEIFVAGLGAFYFMGREVMGNPNSLGAVTAVIAPVLLWGTLIDETRVVRLRRLVLYLLCVYLLFQSHSRAALAAAFFSCSLLCLSLRKYKLFGQGVVVLLILMMSAAIVNPEAFSERLSSFTTSVVYKDRDSSLGVFASRKSPWQGAMDSIRKHLWFGSGFGTTDTGQDASAHLGKFTSSSETNSENGSSYLTIVSWVGILGAVPFLFVLLSLLSKITRTVLWMINTGSPFHPAIPLAMVVVAGLLHAALEDWLFAPGYYVCVFFWSIAFILVDLAPWAPLPSLSVPWRPSLMRQGMTGVAPSR